MKKSEITFIRLMSLALIMVINAAVLLFFVGEHTFQNILNRMNSNVYDGGTLDTSIYNYYFYAGFGSIYKIIFPITILLLVTAAVCVYKKVSMASRLSIAANISAFITGALLLFARITESSKGVHIFINSFYMNKSDIGNIQTVQLMSRIPIAYTVVMVLSVLGLLMVKSSTITKLKIYNDKMAYNNAVIYIFPALSGFIILEVIRNLVISRVVMLSSDEYIQTVAGYIQDYYIGSKFYFNWSWLIIFTIVTCVAIVLNNNNKLMIIEIAVFSIIVIIPSVIYAFNPPSLFGYLTTDNTLCDLTEAAFVWYLVRMSVSLITGIIFIVLVVNERINIKCMYIIAGTLLVLSLAMLIVAGLNRASLSVMYMLCAVADVIGVIVLAVTGLRTLS